MKTCAVVIAAYDCAEYIDDLVRSLRCQIKKPGWKYEIRIGVDGCKKTADKLKKLKMPFYYSIQNVGHGIMRSSLILETPADVYAYFDADDIMMPAYLRRNIEAIESGHRFVMFGKYNVKNDLKIRSKPCVQNGGAMTFTHDVLKSVGGFREFRCAIDTDLMDRAKMTGIKIAQFEEPLYYRRIHDKCLTRAKKTQIGSDYRKEVWAEMTKDRERGIICIQPMLTPLKKVGF